MSNSFDARDNLEVNGKSFEFYDINKAGAKSDLPFSIKVLLENLLRNEDGSSVTKSDIDAILQWDPQADPSEEIAYRPARVLMQDFTGVPAVVDLAAMRDAMNQLGGDPQKINPLQAAELVIDHSVQVDKFGSADALSLNSQIEFKRNQERYKFLKWGQQAFSNFKVVPPDMGIVHQVNLEFLARVVFTRELDGVMQAYPDTVVGTDSHTTMINGVGVLGWGVGGIEAEASMLGQPVSMLIPKVVGFKLTGKLPEGATATDLVLVVVEMLRKHGVVGKFVEFYGDGLDELPLGDRATVANMAPEYGATCGLFPIDAEVIRYLALSNRSEDQLALVEAYAKAQGMWRDSNTSDATYSETLALDLGTVVPSISGPKRPQDRIDLTAAKSTFERDLKSLEAERDNHTIDSVTTSIDGETVEITDGAVVIAAITSCTNTSNPSVMMAAGLVAKNAREKGLKPKPWVKTSLGPGSKAVTQYLDKAGLTDDLEALGFHTVAYGCTTCIGNSGPLREPVSKAIAEGDLTVTSVLSGNRNFEGRVHAEVRMNYLASPPLVIAYALAGTMNIDLYNDALGEDSDGKPVFLRDIWPDQALVTKTVAECIDIEQFKSSYANVYDGDDNWAGIDSGEGDLYEWDDSTYIAYPPYFEGMTMDVNEAQEIHGARVLALLGDSVTTDHISPAGAIKADSPAGEYLESLGVLPQDFNSYGSRRGNHNVMMRGTFANIRLRNKLVPGVEGGYTRHLPDGEQMSIFDAATKYQEDNTPAIIIAGKEYGSGSSRDWAAKGPRLQGVKAVIAETYERIHRSNLIGMGILPLQFKTGESAETHALSGEETYAITGLGDGSAKEVKVTATGDNGDETSFMVDVRIDTPQEVDYYLNDGILHYVLRQLAAENA